jgi:hypothetical protein
MPERKPLIKSIAMRTLLKDRRHAEQDQIDDNEIVGRDPRIVQ